LLTLAEARSRSARSLVSLLLALGVAAAVDAQIPEPDLSANARVHLGPVAMTPGIVCSAGYDTNPYGDPVPVETYEFYATPQVEGWIGRAANRASFWGAVELIAFTDLVGARNWQAGGEYRRVGSRIRPFVRYNAKHTNANPTGYEVGRKSMRIEGDFFGGVLVTPGARFTLGGSFRSTVTRWDADAIYQGSDLRQSLNRRSNAVRGSVGFPVTPLTSLEFGAEATTDRFVYSPERDGNGARVDVGIALASPAVIRGSAVLGYRHFHSLTSSAGDFDGFVGHATLGYARGSGGYLGGVFVRDMDFSYDESLSYYVSTSFEVTAMQTLSTRWRLQGFATVAWLDYRASTNAQGNDQRAAGVGGAVGYNLRPRTVIGASIDWTNVVGSRAWNGLRTVAFLTYGSDNFQRLDRPVPFSR